MFQANLLNDEKNVSLFIVLVFMGLIPVSFTNCCKCGDPGPDQVYKIESFLIRTQYENAIEVQDTAEFYPYDSVGKLIAVDTFKRISYLSPSYGVSFASSATACDCVVPEMIIQNHITTINITCEQDVTISDSISIKAGELLNSYFGVKSSSYQVSYSIAEFLSFSKWPRYEYPDMSIFFNTKPSTEVSLLFDIEITLSDGKKFLFANEQLKIK
jgi:hypothetical protein